MACGAENEDPCEYFIWIDPPMCERAVQVIPGLLRRINGNAEEVRRLMVFLLGLKLLYLHLLLHIVGQKLHCFSSPITTNLYIVKVHMEGRDHIYLHNIPVARITTNLYIVKVHMEGRDHIYLLNIPVARNPRIKQY
ncbi:hypothetical protein RJ639_044169 [Escallonia herrerae]|uniref:Zinc finger, GRF-type n=1 Tax=Escallonia herrerae TaxID=1293975 RepID=A0AA88WAI3_9ASTE|nr:hypothetical protein RJ639_044169 [Escallonia herrerae]